MDRMWKKAERKTSRFFGTRRNPLSGENSGHSSSDSLHPRLFIETKRKKAGHSVVKWWERARTGTKLPTVLVLSLNDRESCWCLCRSEDLSRVALAFFKARLTGQRPCLIRVRSIERKRLSLTSWWDKAERLARAESKTPLLALVEGGRRGFWLLARESHLLRIAIEHARAGWRDKKDEEKVA